MCVFRKRILKTIIVLFLSLNTAIFSEGSQESEIDFPGSLDFRELPIEDQFYFYLLCEPPRGFGYPREGLYVDIMAQREDWKTVFEKAQEYAVTLDLSLAEDGREMSDYRFSLIMYLFGQMTFYHDFTEEQKNWLITHYRSKLIEYLRAEKRIDRHAINVAYEIASYEDEIPDIELQEWGERIYWEYVEELQVVSTEDVLLFEGYLFPGYEGQVFGYSESSD